MASSKFSYEKLSKQQGEEDVKGAVVRKSWVRLRKTRLRRPRIRIAKLGRLVRSVVRKVVKRFHEGKPYLGDLFMGNYMFMQVNPSVKGPASFKYLMDKSLYLSYCDNYSILAQRRVV